VTPAALRKLAAASLGFILSLGLAAPTHAHTLTYRKARRAAQHAADRFAHQPTKVRAMTRETKHRWTSESEWILVDRHGCPGCGYDPTTDRYYDTPRAYSCTVDFTIRFRTKRSHRVKTAMTSFQCLETSTS
jgi:hypothetical protein